MYFGGFWDEVWKVLKYILDGVGVGLEVRKKIEKPLVFEGSINFCALYTLSARSARASEASEACVARKRE